METKTRRVKTTAAVGIVAVEIGAEMDVVVVVEDAVKMDAVVIATVVAEGALHLVIVVIVVVMIIKRLRIIDEENVLISCKSGAAFGIGLGRINLLSGNFIG
jgi:hypothetical protein